MVWEEEEGTAGDEKLPDYEPGELTPGNLLSLEEALNLSPLEVYNRAADELENILIDWGIENGFDSSQMRGMLKENERFLSELTNQWIADAQNVDSAMNRYEDFFPGFEDEQRGMTFVGSSAWMAGNPDGQTNTVERLWGELEKEYPGLGPFPGRSVKKSTTTGRTRMTPTEIRNQYDLTAMAGSVNDVWRLLLLESNPDARQMASDYVEAMVATRGEKAIDFETFIRERAKETARYASIYRKKPDSHSEEQFLQPYFQAAQQRLRPMNAARTAIGGAQFGADAGTFQARLDRSNESITSAPFIQALGARVESLNGVLKG